MKRVLLGFILLILLSSVVGFVSAEDCVVPTDGMIITEDTTFCPGEYYLPNGISIGANDVSLDCNGAKLIGNGTISFFNNGVTSYPYNSVSNKILNCSIQNYTHGILLVGGGNNLLENNVLKYNKWYGIRLAQSDNNIIRGNKLIENEHAGLNSNCANNNLIENNLAQRNGVIMSGWSDSAGMLIGCQTISYRPTHNNKIINNTLIENNRGLVISSASDTLIESNLISDNFRYNQIEIQDPSYENIVINNNIIDSGAPSSQNFWGIRVYSDKGVKITNNLIRGGHYYGISGLLKNAVITKNTFEDAIYYSLILDEGSLDNSIWDNDIYNKGILDNNPELNIYCVNGIGNNYYNGATGPTCPEDLDDDNDGVLDEEDQCSDTEGEQIVYGCDCEQILELKPGNEENSECSEGIIDVFTKQIGWAKGLE